MTGPGKSLPKKAGLEPRTAALEADVFPLGSRGGV